MYADCHWYSAVFILSRYFVILMWKIRNISGLFIMQMLLLGDVMNCHWKSWKWPDSGHLFFHSHALKIFISNLFRQVFIDHHGQRPKRWINQCFKLHTIDTYFTCDAKMRTYMFMGISDSAVKKKTEFE